MRSSELAIACCECSGQRNHTHSPNARHIQPPFCFYRINRWLRLWLWLRTGTGENGVLHCPQKHYNNKSGKNNTVSPTSWQFWQIGWFWTLIVPCILPIGWRIQLKCSSLWNEYQTNPKPRRTWGSNKPNWKTTISRPCETLCSKNTFVEARYERDYSASQWPDNEMMTEEFYWSS